MERVPVALRFALINVLGQLALGALLGLLPGMVRAGGVLAAALGNLLATVFLGTVGLATSGPALIWLLGR